MFKLLWIIFIALFVQGFLTVGQMKSYRAAADRLRQKGRVGMGSKKGNFSPGAIVILASDPNQVIVAGEIMRGMSVFVKPAAYDELNGYTLKRAKKELTKKLDQAGRMESSRILASLQAVQMLLDSYDEKNYDNYRDKKDRKEDFVEDLDLDEVKILDAEITEEHVSERDQTQDVFEGYEDFDEFSEPKIIDVEEIKD